MAIRSGFFNSVNGDRKYNAGSFAEYFATFIGNGVFPNPSNNLQIVANNDMTVTVKAGKAWINGYVLINDDDYILNIEPADGVLSRIDRIVARYDTVDREIRLEVRQGNFASSPIPQELQRDADAYELGLADVLVSNGVISINQANITDLRLNNELCGIVHGTVDQVDTTTIFNQYQAWFNGVKDGTEQEIADWQQQQYDDFLVWFDNIKDILDGDVAANLASGISNLENDFSAHQADLASQEVGKGASLVGFSNAEMTATNVNEAILEAFMLGNSTKQDLVDKLLLVDDSLPITHESSWLDVLNSVNQISTGKKWASGVVTSSPGQVNFTEWNGGTNRRYYINDFNMSALGFVPSTIIFISTDKLDNYPTWWRKEDFNTNEGSANCFCFTGLRVPYTPSVTRIPLMLGSTSYDWIAFE